MGRFSLGQRVVVVVGLGVALWFLGEYISALGKFPGWVAYAPLSRAVNPAPGGLTPLESLLVWLGLVLVWTVSSVLLLKPRQKPIDLDG